MPKSTQDWEALCTAGLQWRGLIGEASNAVRAFRSAVDNSDVVIRTWISNNHEVLDDILWQEYLTCVEYAECRRRDMEQKNLSLAEARARVRSLDPADSLGELGGLDNLVVALDIRAKRQALPIFDVHTDMLTPQATRHSGEVLQQIEDFCLKVHDESGISAFNLVRNIIWSD